MTMQNGDNIDDDRVVFANEGSNIPFSLLIPWKILIVDDEKDVHKVTKLVLSDFVFAGRKVEFLSAYSVDEAVDLLKTYNDIAVILLDVVMEESNSGLKLIAKIRNDLNNRHVRIIIRTGQPGQAPERDIIEKYDINDYRSKLEITSEKMITAIVACLRAYTDVITLERNRRGLERIVIASADIFQHYTYERTLEEFLNEILAHFKNILHSEDSLYHVMIDGFFAHLEGGDYIVKSCTGKFDNAGKGLSVRQLINGKDRDSFDLAITQKMNVYRENLFVGVFRSSNREESVILLHKNYPFDEWEKDLVDIFAANISTAFENRYLNLGLEQKVSERTKELSEAKDDLEIANERLSKINKKLEHARIIAENDMEMAINVQENILPKLLPSSEEWDLSYFYRPMSGISGDFYDFYIDAEGNLSGLSLFDVSGHGVASGLITMLAKSVIYRRFNAMKHHSLARVFDAINEDLVAELLNVPNFLSGIMLRFSGNEVEYVNAGHPGIIVKSASTGTYSFDESPDNPKGHYLGIKEMMKPYMSTTFRMEPDDFAVIFSDCILDTSDVNGKAYGIERLLRAVSSMPAMTAREMLDYLVKDFFSCTGKDPLPDDMTVIIIKKR